MRRKIITAFSCMALIGVLSASAFAVYAKNDKGTENNILNENNDYEKILSPYQNVFNEFNSAHGTTYGFMTDEQLSLHNMDKEEYLKNVVDEYGSMTTEEFKEVLEKAYADENKASAENLPYYQEDTQSGKRVISHCANPDPNGGNVFNVEIIE